MSDKKKKQELLETLKECRECIKNITSIMTKEELKQSNITDYIAKLNSIENELINHGKHNYERDYHDAHTLDEIGTKFGITRERTRQIETNALKKLLAPHIGKKLRKYTEE